MKKCILLKVYEDNRDFNMSILKEVYNDELIVSTNKILGLDLTNLDFNEVSSCFIDFNTGRFMITSSRFLNIIRFAIRHGYKILDIEFDEDINKEQKSLLEELLGFINSESGIIVKSNLLDVLKREILYENDDKDIVSLRLKLGSSDIRFLASGNIELEDNINDLDINILKDLLVYISRW